MKRKLRLLSLSLLTLTLVGCDKANQPTESNSSSSSSNSSSSIVDRSNVLDRWWGKLAGDIKLNGKMKETVTADGKTSSTEYIYNLAYSDGKYFCIDDYDNDYNGRKEGSSVNYCSTNDGYLAMQVITEGNKVETLKLTNQNGNSIKFEQPYTNPFADFDESSYWLDEEDDTDSIFTINEELLGDNSLTDVCSNLTMYDLDYKSIYFTEKDENLSLDIETSDMEDNGKTYQYSFVFDVVTNAGDAFDDLKPFDETEESKRLDNALSQLKDKTNYTINRTSQKLKEDDDGNMVEDGAATTWSVYINGDSLYNEGSKSGYEVKDEKHYQYSYNEDYLKTFAEKSVEDSLGLDDADSLKLFLQPDYSYISGAVFDAVKGDDGSVVYSIKSELSQDSESNIYIELLEDFDNKAVAAQNGLDGFNLRLDKDNNLSMTYLNSSIDYTTWDYIYSLETYTYSAFTTTTIPSFKELAPSKLRDITWELVKDASSDDSIVQAGLTVKVELDSNKDPVITLTKGSTTVAVSDVVVKDGVISFTADSSSWTLSYSIDDDTENQTTTITCTDSDNNSKSYKLTEVGLQAKKDAAIAKLDAIDLTLYSDELDADAETDEKTDKAKVKSYVETCKNNINAATKISDVDEWMEAFDSAMSNINTILQNAAIKEVSDYRSEETDTLYTVILMYTFFDEDVSAEYGTTLEKAQSWNELFNKAIKDIKTKVAQADLDKIVADYKKATDDLLGPVQDDSTDPANPADPTDPTDPDQPGDGTNKAKSNLVRISL